MKKYHIHYNIGKARYVIDYHDGNSKHNDGSEFFDMRIFNNKKKLAAFVSQLRASGYVEHS